MALTASLIVSEDEWVLDSGCTFHITPRKEVLSEFEECEGNKVMMGNNSYCMVKGKGKVTIQNPDGSIVVLSNVRYMPEIGRNLISYGQLEQSGCRYTGKNYQVEFYKGDKKVLTGKYSNGLYYLQGTVKPAEANTSEGSHLQHKKMALKAWTYEHSKDGKLGEERIYKKLRDWKPWIL